MLRQLLTMTTTTALALGLIGVVPEAEAGAPLGTYGIGPTDPYMPAYNCRNTFANRPGLLETTFDGQKMVDTGFCVPMRLSFNYRGTSSYDRLMTQGVNQVVHRQPPSFDNAIIIFGRAEKAATSNWHKAEAQRAKFGAAEGKKSFYFESCDGNGNTGSSFCGVYSPRAVSAGIKSWMSITGFSTESVPKN